MTIDKDLNKYPFSNGVYITIGIILILIVNAYNFMLFQLYNFPSFSVIKKDFQSFKNFLILIGCTVLYSIGLYVFYIGRWNRKKLSFMEQISRTFNDSLFYAVIGTIMFYTYANFHYNHPARAITTIVVSVSSLFFLIYYLRNATDFKEKFRKINYLVGVIAAICALVEIALKMFN